MATISSKTVLVIAPHMDDEVLGCGGTIVKHVEHGDKVHVCFVAHRIYNHQYDEDKMAVELRHSKRASDVLAYHGSTFLDLHDERLDKAIQDIIIPLEKYVYKLEPDIVYSPFCYDNNQDHRAVAQAVQVILRPMTARFLHRWLMYETPSSTEQSPNVGTPVFSPTVYVDIEPYFDTKLDALKCYVSESRKFPHPRSPEGIKALAMKRGMEAGLRLAEAFMLVREKA